MCYFPPALITEQLRRIMVKLKLYMQVYEFSIYAHTYLDWLLFNNTINIVLIFKCDFNAKIGSCWHYKFY
jgi:hypothetical protein